jgi:hypothetical protein
MLAVGGMKIVALYWGKRQLGGGWARARTVMEYSPSAPVESVEIEPAFPVCERQCFTI